MHWDLSIEDDIATLTMDQPDRPVNTLGKESMQELSDKLDRLEEEPLDGLLVRSGKDGSFIVGADIKEIQNIDSEERAFELSREGQKLFQRFTDLPYPSIALVNGTCLGGGFEVALACNYRIASTHPRTELGCPEVKLGLIPGWGGTQRLPRLIGLKNSIQKLLKGESYDPDEALETGVVHEVTEPEHMAETAREWIRRDDLPDTPGPGLSNWGPARWYILSNAHKQTIEKTKGNLPAPLALIRAVREGLKTNLEDGLEIEAEEFSSVCTTRESKNLIRVYFLRQGQKKYSLEDVDDVPAPERVGVIGAGTMGSGISYWISTRDIEVAMVDIDEDAVNKGMKNIKNLYQKGISAGALDEEDRERGLERLHPSVEYDPLQGCDLVIEAVVEEMDIKKKVYQQLSEYVDENTLVASNTSGLSVEQMAQELPYPGNMVGLHFFNPVHRMQLVEVVEAESTSRAALNRGIEFVKTISKTPVRVKDRPGFLVNRVLIPYLNEAGQLLEEGYRIEDIDAALTDFGMPMGPLRLIDEIGIDVSYHVAEHLLSELDTPYEIARPLKDIYEDGLLGQKGGEGFYVDYADEEPNEQYQPRDPRTVEDGSHLARRLIHLMIAEGARCLDEEVVRTADEIDIAMILGTGFAPFRGGLMRYADDYGLDRVVSELEAFREEYGEPYRVPQLLRDRALDGESFTR